MEGILKYNIPEEKEDYTIAQDEDEMDVDIDPQLTGSKETSKKGKSNLRLPPPPLFSRQGVPQLYKYVICMPFFWGTILTNIT